MLIKINKPEEISKIMIKNLKLFIKFLKEDPNVFFQNVPLEFEEFDLLKNKVRITKKEVEYPGKTWLSNKKKEFDKLFDSHSEAMIFLDKALEDIEYDEKKNHAEFIFQTYKYITNPPLNENNEDGKDNKKEKKISIDTIFGELYSQFFMLFYKENPNFTYRDFFIKKFLDKNVDLIACPSCLGEFNFRTAQLDHYFPKSKFPVLSIHPSNLVPICSSCNSTVGKKENQGKGEKTPTSPKNAKNENLINGLQTVFFPYKDSAELKIVGKIEIEIVEKISSTDESTEKSIESKFYPVPLDKTDILFNKKLNNHIDTFNLSSKWASKLPYLYMTIFLQAKKHFLILIRKENDKRKVDKDSIEVLLDEVISLESISDYLYYTYINDVNNHLLKLPDMMLICSYVMWILKNPSTLENLQESLTFDFLEIIKMEDWMKIKPPYFYTDSIYD